MPFGTIQNVSLRGIMCAVPDNRVFTAQRTDLFDEEDLERFEKGTGVTSTYRTLERQLASDLCYEAAEALLKKLGWERESVGALIYASTCFDYRTTATSCVLQHRLGLSADCIVEDMNFGCSAYMYGLAALGSLMQTSDVKRALLLCGDAPSKTNDPSNVSGLMYGDAGTATALAADEEGNFPIHYLLRADGNRYKNIFDRNSGGRHPGAANEYVETSGVDVFAFSTRELPKTILEFMEYFDIKNDDIDLYAFYQVNKKIIGRIIKWCGLQPAKVPVSLVEYGDTGAASIPLVITKYLSNQREQKDNHVVMSGMGAGLSWGAADMVVPGDACTGMLYTRNYYDDDNDCTVTAVCDRADK